MRRPTRATAAGQAYLDLQNRARAEGRATQELLTLYVVERWLARLSMSPYTDQFIIKGGMLLAAYDARRPTADLDALARAVSNDQSVVVERVIQIAHQAPADLAEKITTAIGLGPANTRVRDYADIYTLTRNWPVDHGIAREALLATAAFRGTTLAALSSAVDNLADLRQQTYAAYRANLGTAGEDLPANFSEVVEAVIAFADVLATETLPGTTWSPQQRQWTRKDL